MVGGRSSSYVHRLFMTSGVEEGSGVNGYTGDVTRGAMSVIGQGTDVDDMGRDTGATVGEWKMNLRRNRGQ